MSIYNKIVIFQKHMLVSQRGYVETCPKYRRCGRATINETIIFRGNFNGFTNIQVGLPVGGLVDSDWR